MSKCLDNPWSVHQVLAAHGNRLKLIKQQMTVKEARQLVASTPAFAMTADEVGHQPQHPTVTAPPGQSSRRVGAGGDVDFGELMGDREPANAAAPEPEPEPAATESEAERDYRRWLNALDRQLTSYESAIVTATNHVRGLRPQHW